MNQKIKSVSLKTLDILYFFLIAVPLFLVVFIAVNIFFLIKNIRK